jgi:hypothetical protein
MTGLIAKYAMKKVMNKEMDKYKSKDASGPYVSTAPPQFYDHDWHAQDPYYEEIPHPTKKGKTKKVKKEIPAYIPSQEADVLAKARKTAYRLDYALFTFLGMRFGWSSVIGLIPAVGDVADGVMSLNLIRGMRKVECGLPQNVLLMMLFNLAIDFIIGLVPFIGDLADAAVKCNGKNVRLLEEHLDKVYKPQDMKARDDQLPSAVHARLLSMLTSTMWRTVATPLRTALITSVRRSRPTLHVAPRMRRWACPARTLTGRIATSGDPAEAELRTLGGSSSCAVSWLSFCFYTILWSLIVLHSQTFAGPSWQALDTRSLVVLIVYTL